MTGLPPSERPDPDRQSRPSRPGDPDDGPTPNGAIFAVSVLYLGMVAAAWWSLSLRERTEEIPLMAVGTVGLWASFGIGAALGLGLSGGLTLAVRYVPALRRLQHELHGMVGQLTDGQMVTLALMSSVCEEFTFRLAVQDALGLWAAAALFAMMHFGPRGTRWNVVFALVLGLLFGWLVELGCGLLSVTLAHALVNYLSLRRMESS